MLRQNVNIYLDKNRIPVTGDEEDGKPFAYSKLIDA